MVTADEMRRLAEEGQLAKLRELIERAARDGQTYVDASDFDLKVSEHNKKILQTDGFHVDGHQISWE